MFHTFVLFTLIMVSHAFLDLKIKLTGKVLVKRCGQFLPVSAKDTQDATIGRYNQFELPSGSTMSQTNTKKAWLSGHKLIHGLGNTNNGKSKGGWLRNEPWWMSEKEANNPRMLPKYIPWWANPYESVKHGLSLPELKAVAAKRGVSTEGNKSELLGRLQKSESQNSLSDENFVPPIFKPFNGLNLSSCYPEVYEKHPAGPIVKSAS